jgi:hypothetical protein
MKDEWPSEADQGHRHAKAESRKQKAEMRGKAA